METAGAMSEVIAKKKVSEELNSVETVITRPQFRHLRVVSEELNSVETIRQ